MVISGEEPNKGIDATPGGLVWVRRRNGSWWPGQILDPDEPSEGCVPTPRPGTPVKLLGREDASVDWYNLEKSKRVKPFHSKEFEVCIKRVQTRASLPSHKRAAKYARREDAILHALELENARFGRDRPDLNATPDAQDTEESEDENKDLNSTGDDSESGHENGPCHVDSAKKESKQHGAENDSEDDGSEKVKRMRGLEDLGMGVASTRGRKRSQVGHVQELSKRKKSRPLKKVMECATMVSVPGEDSNESKKNSSVVINNNSDSNGVSSENGDAYLKHKLKDNDVPVAEGKNSSVIISDASRQTCGGGGGAQSSSLGNEACNESGSTRPGTATFGWRLKGKRKSRSRKRYPNNKTQTSVAGAGREGPSARSRRKGPPHNADSGTPRVKPTEQLGRQRVLPLRQSRFTANPKYENSDYSLDSRAASGLYDVKVEVKTSYRPQHVPYISLMSQLTGRPITGHPLQVTVLKDGSCDQNLELDSGLKEDIFTPVNAGKRKGRGGKRKRKRGSFSRARTSQSKSRRNGLLSKKTRKLSSLTGSHRLSYEETKVKKPIVEKIKSPSIACVPLSVVFSRINAALT